MLCPFFLQSSENWSTLGDVDLVLLESEFCVKASDITLFSIGPNNTQFISVLGSRATSNLAQKAKKSCMQNSVQITLHKET